MRERRPAFPKFYQRMISLRQEHSALRQGATRWLRNSNQDQIVTVLRHDDQEEILVAINLGNRPFVGTVELAGSGFVEITTGVDGAGSAALPALSLDSWGVRIFRRATGGLPSPGGGHD